MSKIGRGVARAAGAAWHTSPFAVFFCLVGVILFGGAWAIYGVAKLTAHDTDKIMTPHEVLLAGFEFLVVSTPSEREPTPTPTIADPQRIEHQPADSCRTEVEHYWIPGPHTAAVTVTCGVSSREVQGDFAKERVNHYDPAEAGGIETVLVANRRVEVVMQIDGQRCAFTHDPGYDSWFWGEPAQGYVPCQPVEDEL